MATKKRYKTIKSVLLISLLLIASFIIYVMIINKNSAHMTIRQKLLKAVYPAMMWLTKKAGKNSMSLSGSRAPLKSIYPLQVTLNDCTLLNMNDLKGKKIMLVNSASDCGYTGQYEGLEKLHQQFKDKLVIIAFPANDFKEQEKLDDAEIASFCKMNFGVTFPLAQKSIVINKAGQNEVFKWLTDKSQNGWNNQAPTWNFCKYMLDENGNLTHFFASSVEPTSQEVLDAVSK
ncbi:MAG: glutathione peroxidase [Ferruginibacter sp.]